MAQRANEGRRGGGTAAAALDRLETYLVATERAHGEPARRKPPMRTLDQTPGLLVVLRFVARIVDERALLLAARRVINVSDCMYARLCTDRADRRIVLRVEHTHRDEHGAVRISLTPGQFARPPLLGSSLLGRRPVTPVKGLSDTWSPRNARD
jgi:hypothetical protein